MSATCEKRKNLCHYQGGHINTKNKSNNQNKRVKQDKKGDY